MSATWPSSDLPKPQRRGYGFTPDDGTARTQGKGLIVKRNRQDTILVTTALVFMMTTAQYATFVAWFKYEAQNGKAYILDMPMHDGNKNVYFVADGPAYQAEDFGDYFRVSFSVEWEL